jgi:hypothetical protein
MTLQERIAWLHKIGSTLPIDPRQDLVALRFQLAEMIEMGKEATILCQEEIDRQRQLSRPRVIARGKTHTTSEANV